MSRKGDKTQPAVCDALSLLRCSTNTPYKVIKTTLIGRNEKLKKTRFFAPSRDGRLSSAAHDGLGDDLLRPEPKLEEPGTTQGGLALLGLTFAGLALVAIYISTPIDSPEWPDCPIQALGSCGEK